MFSILTPSQAAGRTGRQLKANTQSCGGVGRGTAAPPEPAAVCCHQLSFPASPSPHPPFPPLRTRLTSGRTGRGAWDTGFPKTLWRWLVLTLLLKSTRSAREVRVLTDYTLLGKRVLNVENSGINMYQILLRFFPLSALQAHIVISWQGIYTKFKSWCIEGRMHLRRILHTDKQETRNISTAVLKLKPPHQGQHLLDTSWERKTSRIRQAAGQGRTFLGKNPLNLQPSITLDFYAPHLPDNSSTASLKCSP